MPDFSTTTFAIRIAKLRAERGITQKQLGDAIGVGQSTITDWERRDDPTDPGLSGVRRLAEFFGCTVDYLVGLRDHQQPLQPGDWLVDLDVLDRIAAGEKPVGEADGVPIPPRHRIVTSTEYARLLREAKEKATARRKKR